MGGNRGVGGQGRGQGQQGLGGLGGRGGLSSGFGGGNGLGGGVGVSDPDTRRGKEVSGFGTGVTSVSRPVQVGSIQHPLW